jgi:alanyl-tRNA synthetase
VLALLRDGVAVDALEAGDEGIVILERTPFYAESGGQVGDRGQLVFPSGTFDVLDTRKQGSDTVLHLGRVSGGSLSGTRCEARVDPAARTATALNHSATHLLHAALRKILGSHVTQKGSLVNPERLRFDFSHFEPIQSGCLEQIEQLVNAQIRANHAVDVALMSRDAAVSTGAMALFGEKYGEVVRVLRMGDFSTELCGGTHASRVGDIGLFKIISETGVAAGVRRIEAVTGENACDWVRASESLLQGIAERLKSGRDTLDEKVQQLLDKNRLLEKEIERLKGKMASSAGDDLSSQAVTVNGIQVLAARIDEADVKTLRELVDQLRNKLGSAAVVLGSVSEGRVNLIAGVTRDQLERIKAGDLVNAVATQVGGKGGGRPDMAQAGGTQPGRLDEALNSVVDWVRQQTA